MNVKKYTVVDTKSSDGVLLSDHCALFVEAELNAQRGDFPFFLDTLSMDGSKVTELRKSAYVYDFEFSAPADRHLVYFYKAELYSADGIFLDSRKIWSRLFDRDPPETRTCTFSALEPETEYIVKIYPCSAGAQYGSPLIINFTTTEEH